MTDPGSPSVVEETVNSTTEFLEKLYADYPPEGILWYRGHARDHWKLQPSLIRYKEGLNSEQVMMEEFRRDAAPLLGRENLIDGTMTEWDWVFLLQHHHVPTRLLDWSESPLVGLFFALDESGVIDPPGDAALWVLQPITMNELGRVYTGQPRQIPMCGVDNDDVDKYLPSNANMGQRVLDPLAVAATRSFSRLRAQSGVFTVTHRDTSPLENKFPGALKKFIIPEAAKDQFRIDLARLGYHAAAMYPDLEHLGKRVAERVKK